MAVDGPNVQKIQVKTNRRAGSSPKKQNSKKNSLVEKKVGNKCNTTVHETERGPEEEEEDHLNSSFTSTSRYGSINVILCPTLILDLTLISNVCFAI